MKRHLTAALAAAAFLLPSFALAETRTLDVAGFHGVDISSGIRALITGGKPHSVVANAKDAQTLTDLRYEVRDGILHLWYDWTIGDIFDFSDRQVTITIGTEQLDDLEVSAGASIVAAGLMGENIGLEASSGASMRTNVVEGMFYSIEASSGARIETSGSCTDAQIEVSNGASVAAQALDCSKVILEGSTGGLVEITARDSIGVELSTGSHAVVHGKPSVDHLETSTGGSVDFPG